MTVMVPISEKEELATQPLVKTTPIHLCYEVISNTYVTYVLYFPIIYNIFLLALL